MSPAACGTVVAGNIDHANVAAPVCWFPQSRLGDVCLRNISNLDTSIFADDPVGQFFGCFGLFTRNRIHRQVDRARCCAEVKADGRPSENLRKGLRQNVLAGMLLHMIRTSSRIDSRVNRRAGSSALDNMDDVPTGFIFQTLDERQTVNSSKIVFLAAGSRAKRRLDENDAEAVADAPAPAD